MTVDEEAQLGPAPDGRRRRFVDATSEAFDVRGERAGVHAHDLMIAGARIRLRFAGPALEPLLLPSIRTFGCPHRRATSP